MTCLNCNNEIEDNKNGTKKYCSDKCRKQAARHVGQTMSDKIKTFKVIEEKDSKGGDMYFCSTHGEHCKNYCEAMCDNDCNHILKDE